MAIECKKCGYENADGTKICAICGADLLVHGKQVQSNKIIYGGGMQSPPVQLPPIQPKQSPPPIQQKKSPPPIQQAPPLTKPHLVLPGGKRQILFANATLLIGSQGCALNLTGLQTTHAEITSTNGGFAIQPVNNAPIQVNGKPISVLTTLNPNDSITLVTHTLSYQGPSAQAPIQQQPPPIQSPLKPIIQSPPIQPPLIIQSNQLPSAAQRWGKPQIEGHVIHVDGPFMEAPDMTGQRLFYTILSIPFFFTRFGPFLVMRPAQQQPVRNVRVRDAQGQERLIRVKGNLISGAINHGDDVVAWGKWRDQTLNMRRAYNQRLSTVVLLDCYDSDGARLARLFYQGTLYLFIALFVLSLLSAVR